MNYRVLEIVTQACTEERNWWNLCEFDVVGVQYAVLSVDDLCQPHHECDNT